MYKKLAIAILVITILACGGSQTPEAVKQEKAEPPPTPATYAIGETVAIGDIQMTVNSVEDVTPEILKPKDSNKFILVDVTFENTGDKAASVSSALQMKVKDDSGQQYTINISASTYGASTPDGEVGPGSKLRGQVGYEVPTEASGLQFVYDASLLGSGQIVVNLP